MESVALPCLPQLWPLATVGCRCLFASPLQIASLSERFLRLGFGCG